MMTIEVLKQQFPRAGRVAWIGLRTERKAPLLAVAHVEAIAGRGLLGDRAAEKVGGKRQVTLIMAEHLAAAASILDIEQIHPGLTRRNIVVQGINLLSLKGKRFKIGSAELELSDECHPCSRMEENLGPGGYNAMRGHGGWCAIVLQDGDIHVGDAIEAIASQDS